MILSYQVCSVKKCPPPLQHHSGEAQGRSVLGIIEHAGEVDDRRQALRGVDRGPIPKVRPHGHLSGRLHRVRLRQHLRDLPEGQDPNQGLRHRPAEGPPQVRPGRLPVHHGLLHRVLRRGVPASQAGHGRHPRLLFRRHRALGPHHLPRDQPRAGREGEQRGEQGAGGAGGGARTGAPGELC